MQLYIWIPKRYTKEQLWKQLHPPYTTGGREGGEVGGATTEKNKSHFDKSESQLKTMVVFLVSGQLINMAGVHR